MLFAIALLLGLLMKWFQKSFILVAFLFSTTMAVVVVVAFLRPSGLRKIDVITMQELRSAAIKTAQVERHSE